MSDNKAQDIFFWVIAIVTLIIAIVGATFAYFYMKVSSEVIGAKAGTISISYDDGQQVTAKADLLIPSSFEVVKDAYARSIDSFGTEEALRSNVCVDDLGRQVCSIYRFSITNNSEVALKLIGTLNNDLNEFKTDFSFEIYEVSGDYATDEARWQILNDTDLSQRVTLNYCSNQDELAENYCYNIDSDNLRVYNSKIGASNSIFGSDASGMKIKSINAYDTKVYDLVLFLNETNQLQNEDSGKEYLGTIIIKVVGRENVQVSGNLN